jgi:hypothetical protein
MSTRTPASTKSVGSRVLNRGDPRALQFLMQGEILGNHAILDAQRGVFRIFRTVEMVVVSSHEPVVERNSDWQMRDCSRRNGSGTRERSDLRLYLLLIELACCT